MPSGNSDLSASSGQRLRILMLVRRYHPWVGGTERQAHKLASQLIAMGVDVQVVTGWWFRGTPQREQIGLVPVFRNFTAWEMFGLRGLRKLGGYLYLLTLLGYLGRHRHEYDLIHVHLLNYHAFAAVLAGRWWGKPVIVKLANSGSHSDLRRMEADMLPGQRAMLPTALRADRLIAINDESATELRTAGVPATRIMHIPNGVEIDEAADARDYAAPGRRTIAYVGRLHPSKGADVLLTALRRVVDTRPDLDWALWLFGDGQLRGALEAQAQALGLAERVTFWGTVAPLTPYLDQADLFALPSRSEGISNALLEAMARGLPCVVSAIGGNTDLIHSGENGLLTAPEDAAGLAAALVDMLDDEALRRRLGTAARRTVEAGYSLESVARQYLALYRSLLDSPAPREGEPGDHR